MIVAEHMAEVSSGLEMAFCAQAQYGMLIPMLVRPIAERFHAQDALLGLPRATRCSAA